MRHWCFSYYDTFCVFRRICLVAADKDSAVETAMRSIQEKQNEAALVWCCMEV